MRAAIYARVSSAVQREKHTIENQLRDLPAYVAQQGWTLAHTFVDDGRSAKAGKLDLRDGFAAMLRAAAARSFDVVVVVDVDRLTRTDDMTERAAILGPFQTAGIVIATPSSGVLDLRTFLGEFYATMQALFAAEENRKRIARSKAGKARAIAEGRKPSGPTPYGLLYSRNTGTWAIDPHAAVIVREIYERLVTGDSCLRIADDLNHRGIPRPRGGLWNNSRVYLIATSRYTVGEWCPDRVRGALIAVPPIVTEEQWTAAQTAMRSRRVHGLLHRTKHVYLLEGLGVCAACGTHVMIRAASGRSAASYICRARLKERSCSAPLVRTVEKDAEVWTALCDEFEQPELLLALAAAGERRAGDARNWAADAEGYRAHIVRLDRLEADWMARRRRGQVSDGALDIELSALGRERKVVRDQLATAERAIGATMSAKARTEAAQATVAQLREALPLATPEQRRALIRELVRDGAVTFADGRVRLDFRLALASDMAAGRASDGNSSGRSFATSATSCARRSASSTAIPKRPRVATRSSSTAPSASTSAARRPSSAATTRSAPSAR